MAGGRAVRCEIERKQVHRKTFSLWIAQCPCRGVEAAQNERAAETAAPVVKRLMNQCSRALLVVGVFLSFFSFTYHAPRYPCALQLNFRNE